MSKHPVKPLRSYGSWAMLAWLVALAVFLLWLGWVLFSTYGPKKDAPNDQRQQAVLEAPGPRILNLPKGGPKSPNLDFDPDDAYVLAGSALQGFYQNSAPDEVWTISYPEPRLAAQVIKRGPPEPRRVTKGIRVTWELLPQVDSPQPAATQSAGAGLTAPATASAEAGVNQAQASPPEASGPAADNVVASGSAETISAAQPGSEPGTVDKGGQAPSDGPAVASGQNILPARKGEMEAVAGSHFEASIPVSPLGINGEPVPYQVVKLRAEDQYTGRLLAESAVVVGVSPGFGCAHCHENAGQAILEVHDRHASTKLLAESEQGRVVACRDCHGASGASEGQEGEGASTLNLSAAIHGWHAAYLDNRAEDACMTCHISLARIGDGEGRAQPMFARDFHTDRGISCVRCHGYLEDHALALLKAEDEAGVKDAGAPLGSIRPRAAALEDIQPRQPWVQEPDCTGCHNFMQKPNLKTASAFNKWTPLQSGENGLYSARKDNMQMVRCATCHGAPHAVYPARNPLTESLDNLPPLQYQEQAAPFGAYNNCAMCHGEAREFSAHHPILDWSYAEVHVPDEAQRFMPPALFPHQAHVPVVSCNVCHHTGHEDGKSLLCTSSGCHDGVMDNGTAEQPDTRYFYNAFHEGFPSCLGCHEGSLEKGEPAGPTDCQACHQAPSSRWADTE